MKPLWYVCLLLWLIAAIPQALTSDAASSRTVMLNKLRNLPSAGISCAPDRDAARWEDPLTMVPLPGWGSYRWPGRSGNDSTSFYLNQGITLYYSFHILESMASFRKAAALSPEDPMPYWGIALAYGPNINDVSYRSSPQALEAARKADAYKARATAFEQALISAMLLRYSDRADDKRQALDEAYAEAMKTIYRRYPKMPDAGALYADALMLLHPWDLYTQDQQPKAWTPELVDVLETVLKSSPTHPGANHYYIHAVEASASPGRAIASANRLGNLTPMVSHMVHMPSHIYIRTGQYDRGIAVNKQAVEGYNRYLSLVPESGNGAFLYLLHNLHMQATSAMNDGQYAEARAAALALQASIPPEYLAGPPPEAEYLQYMYLTPLFTAIRFGQWDSVLQSPPLPDSLAYGRILQLFGTSIAHARRGRYADAAKAMEQMEALLTQTPRLHERMGAFNTAYAGGEVALWLARGILEEEQGHWPEAIEAFQQAVKREDQMVYNEPKDWLLPPRQYLGSALWKSGRYAEAIAVFDADLAFNPGNGWSLLGKALSLEAKGDPAAARVRKEATNARKGKEFNHRAPVF